MPTASSRVEPRECWEKGGVSYDEELDRGMLPKGRTRGPRRVLPGNASTGGGPESCKTTLTCGNLQRREVRTRVKRDEKEERNERELAAGWPAFRVKQTSGKRVDGQAQGKLIWYVTLRKGDLG